MRESREARHGPRVLCASNKASNRRFAQVIRPTDACLEVRVSPIRLPPRGSKTDPGL
jgi:hypothetical protein